MIVIDWKCGKQLHENAFNLFMAGLLGIDFKGAPFDDNDFDVSVNGSQLTIAPGFLLVKNRQFIADGNKPAYWIIYSDEDMNLTVPLNDSGALRVDTVIFKILRNGTVSLSGVANDTVASVEYIINETNSGTALSDEELDLRIPQQYDYLRLADITVPNNSNEPSNIANNANTVLLKLKSRMGL